MKVYVLEREFYGFEVETEVIGIFNDIYLAEEMRRELDKQDERWEYMVEIYDVYNDRKKYLRENIKTIQKYGECENIEI